MNRHQRRAAGAARTIANAPGWGDAVREALRRWPGIFDGADFADVGTFPVAPVPLRFEAESVGVLAFAGVLIRAGAGGLTLDAAGGGLTDRTGDTVRVSATRMMAGAVARMTGRLSLTGPEEWRAVVATLDTLAKEGRGPLRDDIAAAGVMPDA